MYWKRIRTAVAGFLALGLLAFGAIWYALPAGAQPEPGGPGAAIPMRWQYARVLWEDDIAAPTHQRVTWEGPDADPVRADSFKALAGKLHVTVRSDSSTALLNALGADGWELVTLNYKFHGTAAVREMDWTLKRRR